MKSKFLKFVVTTNHKFMFHRNSKNDTDIVSYNMFYRNVEHIATVHIYKENDEFVCAVTDVNGENCTHVDIEVIARVCDGEIVSIWQTGFNDIAELVRRKLKLKAA